MEMFRATSAGSSRNSRRTSAAASPRQPPLSHARMVIGTILAHLIQLLQHEPGASDKATPFRRSVIADAPAVAPSLDLVVPVIHFGRIVRFGEWLPTAARPAAAPDKPPQRTSARRGNGGPPRGKPRRRSRLARREEIQPPRLSKTRLASPAALLPVSFLQHSRRNVQAGHLRHEGRERHCRETGTSWAYCSDPRHGRQCACSMSHASDSPFHAFHCALYWADWRSNCSCEVREGISY